VLTLGAVFTVLLGVNAYFLYFKKGTSLRSLLRATEAGDKAPAAIVPKADEGAAPAPSPKKAPAGAPSSAADDEDARVVEGTLSDKDTIEAAWRRAGVPAKEVADASAALATLFDLRTARGGHTFTLRYDAEDQLRAIEYRLTPALGFRLVRDPAQKGGWRAIRDEKPLETRIVEVGGTVGWSIYDGMRRAGEGGALVAGFVDLFSYDLNFYVDCQAGDRFRVIVEKRYLGGKFYKYGRILAAEYAGKSGTLRAFWFDAGDGKGGAYYTEHGESIARSLVKTPLKYVRISSAFDRRRLHPILHTERAHLGVDYAAPVGTPVWAAASGRVTSVGPRGGGGNVVTIAHGNGLETVYMHLSRFAKGLHPGQEVRQKQVIGYVGSTGLSTGPHLHFSLRDHGTLVDPLRYKAAREQPLDPRHRAQFADAIAPRLAALAAIPVRQPDRLVARGPSPMP
jgi:murein DD-endopeptidase MepM/ murein hydrolase activator NlpD